MRTGRAVAAAIISIIAVPLGVWAALVAGLTLVQQVLAGFLVIADASWTQALNPAVWFGWQNMAGTGSFLDSMLGGPGAPGGTVSRWLVFMVSAALASACYAAVTTAWGWARRQSATQSPSTLDR